MSSKLGEIAKEIKELTGEAEKYIANEHNILKLQIIGTIEPVIKAFVDRTGLTVNNIGIETGDDGVIKHVNVRVFHKELFHL